MPFRDKAWEDLQRDCAIFPAYTDYLLGPDLRPEADEEPGLHPLLFPPQLHVPIRYTNSKPSRTWSYSSSQGTVRPYLATIQPQSGEYAGIFDVGLSKEDRGRGSASLDLRSPTGSPMSKLIPPQSVRPDSVEEMARRRTFNAAQHHTSTVSAATSGSLQPFFRDFQQQAQAQGGPISFSATGGRAPNPPLQRSSSATDFDDQLLHMATHDGPMLSPLGSSPLMASCPAQPFPLQSQFNYSFSNLPSHAFSDLSPNLLAVTPQGWTPRSPTTRIPLIQPNDLIENPRYVFVASKDGQKINKEITARWNVVHNEPDLDKRAKAMLEIQRISQMIHTMGERYEEELRRRMEMQEQRRAQAGQQSYMQPRNESFAQPSQLATSPQLDRMNQILPAVEQVSPQSSQRPLPLMQQSPSQISQKLRTNIDAHLPKLLQCLQISSGHSFGSSSLPSEADAEKQYAKHWLESFKVSLPPEGRQYVQQVVARVLMAKAGGMDAMKHIVW